MGLVLVLSTMRVAIGMTQRTPLSMSKHRCINCLLCACTPKTWDAKVNR